MEGLNLAGAAMGFRRCALSAGTTNTFTTGLDQHYTIDGQAYSAAALSNFAGPTTDGNTGLAFKPVPANSACIFVFAIDGSGTFAVATRVMQGSIVPLDNSTDGANATYVSQLSQFPAIPDTVAIYGWMVVKVGSGGSPWAFGVSNTSGVSNVQLSFTSASCLPDRPRS
jgi:hypothetical protein